MTIKSSSRLRSAESNFSRLSVWICKANGGMGPQEADHRRIEKHGGRVGAGADIDLTLCKSAHKVHFPREIVGASDHFAGMFEEDSACVGKDRRQWRRVQTIEFRLLSSIAWMLRESVG